MAQVTGEMTIAEALKVNPGIAEILTASGMHCLGCMMAHGETVSEAALVHGLDPSDLLGKINEYLIAQ